MRGDRDMICDRGYEIRGKQNPLSQRILGARFARRRRDARRQGHDLWGYHDL